MIHLVIPGKPHAQGRPRAVRIGTGVRMYDHPQSAKWKKYAASIMSEVKLPTWTVEPLLLRIRAIYPMRKDRHRKRAPRPSEWRLERPDIDNIAKAVMDAMQMAKIFKDDSQVVKLEVEKTIGAQGEEPRVEIWIDKLEAL